MRSDPNSAICCVHERPGDLATRRNALTSQRLTRSELEPLLALLLTHEDLLRWNCIVDIPVEWGPGGESPSAYGEILTCERCKEPYVVRPSDHGPAVANACTHHWGKSLYRSIGGELLDSFVLPWLISLHSGEPTRTQPTHVVCRHPTVQKVARADRTSFTRQTLLCFKSACFIPRLSPPSLT